eukprot:jgi/Botrbrau1/5299/Bobra.0391s0018.2
MNIARWCSTLAAVLLIPVLALLLRHAIINPWDPEIILDEFVHKKPPVASGAEVHTSTYVQKDIKLPLGPRDAPVEGEAYLFLPKGVSQPPPLVVMAPGLGQQRDMGLAAFAEVFAAQGLACLILDYRSFGGSEGHPRHFISPMAHVEDILSAVTWVKEGALNASVDASRVALWGTSFGGGHVLVAGSKLRDSIAAIVSLVPHLSGRQAYLNNLKTRGLVGSLRMLAAGLVDVGRAKLGLPPAYLKLAGPLGSLSLMPMSPSEFQTYTRKHPPEPLGGWQMRVTARSVLLTGRYSPIDHVDGVKVPTLITTASEDTLCPPGLANTAVAKNPLLTHRLVDCSHFEVYTKMDVKEDHATFLAKHLAAEQPAL